VNRTDRLYALVEELRAVAPRPRSARQLAERYEVSTRTVERDILALQQAGVPIYAESGRRGGYVLDKETTLPPVNFTPHEAAALAVLLAQAGASPFARATRSALLKVLAAMPTGQAAAVDGLLDRVRLFEPVAAAASARPVPSVISDAIVAGKVLRMVYTDRHGAATGREVEPVAFVHVGPNWYLAGWCRLRGEPRAFRLDRIRAAELTDEPAARRRFEDIGPQLPDYVPRSLALA
jgi:predicted DNA-binding transcriptional regulator YafY